MDKITLKSYAKINITLDVLRKREDGYHDVKMIMQSISLHDRVTIKKDSGITVNSNYKYLPVNEKNIAYKSAVLFSEKLGKPCGADIYISKRVPVAAGLAGGSGNAAAVLIGLNKLYENPFSEQDLLKIGKEIGSDVPFCMTGGTALSEGVGEILTPLPNISENTIFLVAKPSVYVSTAGVYGKLNASKIAERPDTAGCIESIKSGDTKGIAVRMFNVLESVTASEHPIITDIKLEMIRLGAIGSVMSGSGPSVIGIFEDKEKANSARKELLSSCRNVFLTHAVGCGTEEFKYYERKQP